MKRAAGAGLAVAAVVIASAEVGSALFGAPTLGEWLREVVLAALPGSVAAAFIDRFQHAAKVIAEVALVLAVLAAGALAGALTASVRPGASRPADVSRRAVLRRIGVAGVGVAATLVFVSRAVPRWREELAAPESSPAARTSGDITPAESFYIVSKNFRDPVIPASAWSLRVGGLVASTLVLDYDELRAFPASRRGVTLECISNPVGGPLLSTGEFSGVLLADILAKARVDARASAVTFRANDGYRESLALATLAPLGVLVAYDLNGAPLPPRHGGPARILVPGRYGMKSVKWIEELEVVTALPSPAGYWERLGWDPSAPVQTTSRIDLPREGDTLPLAPIELGGVAYAGERGIARVEVSADGATWMRAETRTFASAAWTRWRLVWTPPGAGAYLLRSRAIDGRGALQIEEAAPSFPAGATGLHGVRVQVTER